MTSYDDDRDWSGPLFALMVVIVIAAVCFYLAC